ncbi:hypothetical protein CRENBAI_006023 [Crenichthys baileyi]|uniref:Uncharacterized protein n=1 Tax=Crenichthys baileyi TaxID=28760 RepID=A0AAV9S847_9TELE
MPPAMAQTSLHGAPLETHRGGGFSGNLLSLLTAPTQQRALSLEDRSPRSVGGYSKSREGDALFLGRLPRPAPCPGDAVLCM